MSHEIESLFYTREKPWHGLGTMVEEAPTSADAIRLAGLDWEVSQQEIVTTTGIKANGYFANVRSSDNKILGIVGNRYQIVQNKEAFDFTDSIISGDVKYETAGSLCGGKRIWLLARLPERNILGDAVEPYLVFTNTHDGTGSIKVASVPVRVVCNNTLNLALKKAKRTWSTRHIGDISTKMDEAKRCLELADEYFVSLSAEAEMLANIAVNNDKVKMALSKVFPIQENDTDRKKHRVEELMKRFAMCYNMDDIKQFKGTAWGAVNAMADMVSHPEAGRNTSTYLENNWGKIIDGRTVLDEFKMELVNSGVN